jgi:predicted ATP-grasp superfamily ATP-dependent carboligase
MSAPASVLITNAEERSMLAACRSLCAGGYQVGAAAFRRFAATHASRCCTRRLALTDPAEDAQGFIVDLCRELAGGRYAVLMAGSDRALLAISHWREELEDLTAIGLPAPPALARALDREALAAAATAAGFPAPESIRCHGEQEAIAAARELGFPVILKSLHTVELVGNAVHQAPASRSVADERQLAGALGEHSAGVLVQRAAPGRPYSFAGVIAGGRLLGVAMARYLRTWPAAAGNVAFAETIAVPAGLEEQIRELLLAIGWQGIFELELIGQHDGRFLPIDLNPRPYGSLALAVSAGAPLPAIWCDWLRGLDPSPVRARPGQRYRWEDADLCHLAWQLRRGHLRAALAAARPRRRVAHAHFQLADPLPLFMRGLYLGHRRSAR